jgi:hypothetical protein
MRRRSFLSSVPQVVLAAAGAFGAGRVSTSRPPDAPPCGAGGAGGGGSQPPEPPEPPAPPGPEAAPGLVPPLPTPTEGERAWLQEWLDLVTRPSGTAASGC